MGRGLRAGWRRGGQGRRTLTTGLGLGISQSTFNFNFKIPPCHSHSQQAYSEHSFDFQQVSTETQIRTETQNPHIYKSARTTLTLYREYMKSITLALNNRLLPETRDSDFSPTNFLCDLQATIVRLGYKNFTSITTTLSSLSQPRTAILSRPTQRFQPYQRCYNADQYSWGFQPSKTQLDYNRFASIPIHHAFQIQIN